MEGLYPIVRRRRRPLVQVADAVEAAGLIGPAATVAPLPIPEAEDRQETEPEGKTSNAEEAETLY